MRNYKNLIIKHEKSMDLCFKVVAQWTSSKKYILKGYWINMGFVESYRIFPQPVTIEINRTDDFNWLIATEPGIKCLRNSNWLKIAGTPYV